MRIPGTAHICLTAAMLAALAVAACSSANISSFNIFDTGSAPEAVVVGALVVPPGSVVLDSSVAAQLRRQVRGQDSAAARQQITSEVSSIMVTTVVDRLAKAGLPARPGVTTIESAQQRTLLVGGAVATIDQGNRMKRNIIGFGAGKSQIVADVSVAMADGAGRKQLVTFRAEADSGRRPGAVATAPVAGAQAGIAAAAAGSAAGGAISEKLRGDIGALARNLGDAIADKVIEYAIAQGWIAKPA